MSSDFGDDSGEAMLRWAERVGERGGARALIEAAGRLRESAAEVRERPHGTSAGPGMLILNAHGAQIPALIRTSSYCTSTRTASPA